MSDRTERQHATVNLMIDIAEQMAAQTQRIARREAADEALRRDDRAVSLTRRTGA